MPKTRSDIVRRLVRRFAVLAPREDPFEIANLAAEEMEAAGFVFESEEEPMAEEVTVMAKGAPGPHGHLLVVNVADGRAWRYLTKAEAQLAADLYNRRKKIATVAGELRARADTVFVVWELLQADLRRWAALLEGKEKP